MHINKILDVLSILITIVCWVYVALITTTIAAIGGIVIANDILLAIGIDMTNTFAYHHFTTGESVICLLILLSMDVYIIMWRYNLEQRIKNKMESLE